MGEITPVNMTKERLRSYRSVDENRMSLVRQKLKIVDACYSDECVAVCTDVHTYQQRVDLINAKIEEAEQEMLMIESWIASIENFGIQAIARDHFINGLSWNECQKKEKRYRYYEEGRARHDFYEYCKAKGIN